MTVGFGPTRVLPAFIHPNHWHGPVHRDLFTGCLFAAAITLDTRLV
ncbi:hypothetical protein yfred0001_38600 [Yersinia frederiksenii ATCC 33641]|nr:hypothetical protein yfred0001_38600 [Yersinia frederiksenii ATCC 33641]